VIINVTNVFNSLSDMERDFVEAEAAARGVPVALVIVELVRDGLRLVDDMDEVFQPTDRQWKSH
jgi:hypothetical protein